MNSSNSNAKKRSQKNKEAVHEKAELWNIFDANVVVNPIECLYNSNTTAHTREYCDECKASVAYSEEGFLTCTNSKCGIIFKDVIDHSPEWRFYGADAANEADPSRCGMPVNPLLEESSFGCKVISTGKSSYEMRKIRQYTEWQSMPYREKTLYDEFQRITVYANNAGISKKIIDDAIRYYKKISEYEQSFRGDNKDGLIAASIYISCRINHYPRTAKELAMMFHLDVTSATHGCKNALTIVNNLEKDMSSKDKTAFCKMKPEDFIQRYCSMLNINSELTRLCQFIAIKIKKKNLMPENTPHSIASGIIYFIAQVCNLNVSKKEVKSVSNISEVTINKCFKKLEKLTNELVPTIIRNKYGSPKSLDSRPLNS